MALTRSKSVLCSVGLLSVLALSGCSGEGVPASTAQVEMLNNATRPEGIAVGTSGTLRAAGWIQATKELYDVTLDSREGIVITARRADIRTDITKDELSVVLRDVTWVDATSTGTGEIQTSDSIIIGPWAAGVDLIN